MSASPAAVSSSGTWREGGHVILGADLSLRKVDTVRRFVLE